MTALLKAKSKIKIERKPRVQYPVKESLKRLREPPKTVVVNTDKSVANTVGGNSGTSGTNADSQGQSQAKTQA